MPCLCFDHVRNFLLRISVVKNTFLPVCAKRNSFKQHKNRSSGEKQQEHEIFDERNWQNTKMPQSCCVVAFTNRKVKETKLAFYLFCQEPLSLRKREKKTGWGKLIVKIGTIKTNGHTKGFRNKEFVEHTFCQVSWLNFLFLFPF